MAQIYYDRDADSALITSRRVAIIGFGSQGHAHALNLLDSGVPVVVGLREESASRQEAEEAGLTVVTPAQAAEQSNVIMMLVPDQHMADLYHRELRNWLERIGDARGVGVRLASLEDEVEAVVAQKAVQHRRIVLTANRIYRWRQEMTTHGNGHQLPARG